MAHCQKHGSFSVICRECDLDTIEEDELRRGKRLTFSKSDVEFFDKVYLDPLGTRGNFHKVNGHSYGQAFYNWFMMEFVTNEEDIFFCNKLRQSSDEEAKKLVATRLASKTFLPQGTNKC